MPLLLKLYYFISTPGLDIGLSQWSLEYITLSLYTMTKTTSTPFILLFGLLFKLERKVRRHTLTS